jgi:hypothetical protein
MGRPAPIADVQESFILRTRSFLKNPHLTAALIDRLTENSHVINIEAVR